MPAVPQPLRRLRGVRALDGALYASGGDGASFNFADWGQDGAPLNPCGDPPGGVGATLSPPTAEGGALRSQDLRTAGDPVSLDGTVIRVNPATGAGLPTNPLASSADPNARRIVAYGLRNPFRVTERPGTDELWVGDVGWNDWEEINRLLPVDHGGPQLRLALLRGRGPPGRLRRREPQRLREPLLRRPSAVTLAVLRLPPHRARRAQRDVPDRQLVDGRGPVRLRLRRRVPIPRSTTTRCSSRTTPVTASG